MGKTHKRNIGYISVPKFLSATLLVIIATKLISSFETFKTTSGSPSTKQ